MSKLGNPKYKYGDKVKFDLGDRILEGTVYIVDKYGTFEFPDDVCYDILACEDKYKSEINPLGECLYKHIKENLIIG